MTTPRPRCAACNVVVPDGYRRVVFENRVFCRTDCLHAWSLREVSRQRAWLSQIAGTTRGVGADLATSALYSERFPDSHSRR